MASTMNRSKINLLDKITEYGAKAKSIISGMHKAKAQETLEISRYNFIINGDHQVNQRGLLPITGVTNETYQATDRWKTVKSVVTGNATLANNKLRITATSSNTGYARFDHHIEDYASLAGKTITISALVTSNTSNGRIIVYNTTDSYLAYAQHTGSGNEEKLTITCKPSANLSDLRIIIGLNGATTASTTITSGDYVEFTNVKLEIGDTATPFVKESYDEVLRKCGAVDDSNTYGAVPFIGTAGSAVIGIGTTNEYDVAFYDDTGATAKVYWDSSAETLGIGTSSPTKNLEVRNTSTGAIGLSRDVLVGGENTLGIAYFGGRYDATNYAYPIQIHGMGDGAWASGNTPAYLRIYTTPSGSSTPVERLRINSSGNVGIGTSTYFSKFHVGNSSTDWVYVEPAGDSIATFAPITTGAGSVMNVNIGSGQYSTSGVETTRLNFLNSHGNDATSTGFSLKVYKSTGATATDQYFAIEDIRRNASASVTHHERLRIDSSGNVGIGVTPSAWNSAYQAMQIGVNGSLSATTADNNYLYAMAGLYLSGGYKLLSSNGLNVSAYTQSNGIHTLYSAAGGTAGATVTPTSVLSVEKAKSLALEGATSQTGTGITFPATQSASSNANTLDDYEEGTFTPTIVGTSTAGTGTYVTQNGTYTKVGRLVFFRCYLTWSAHTGTGDIRLDGLPFASNSTGGTHTAVTVAYPALLTLTANNLLHAYININSSSVTIAQYPVGGGSSTAVPMDTAANIMLSGCYQV